MNAGKTEAHTQENTIPY
jgi:hypothetical protein